MVGKRKRVSLRPKPKDTAEFEIAVDPAEPGSDRTGVAIYSSGTVAPDGAQDPADIALDDTGSPQPRGVEISSMMAAAFARLADAASSVSLPEFEPVHQRAANRPTIEETSSFRDARALEERINGYLRELSQPLQTLSVSTDTVSLNSHDGFAMGTAAGPTTVEFSATLDTPTRMAVPRIGLAVIASLMVSRRVAVPIVQRIARTYGYSMIDRMQLIATEHEAYLVLEVRDGLSPSAPRAALLFDADGSSVGIARVHSNRANAGWALDVLGRMLR